MYTVKKEIFKWEMLIQPLPTTVLKHEWVNLNGIYSITSERNWSTSTRAGVRHRSMGESKNRLEGGGGAPSVRISRKKGSFFKTSACPRFCKRRVLFCTQVRSMGVKIPLQSTKYTRLWHRVTPEVTGLPSLLPPLAAAKQAEDYKILS